MQAVLIGNLTIDQNTIDNNTYTMPGGAVYYMAKTFENLGADTTIISPYGADFPKKSLPSASFIPDKALFKKTLGFRNIYNSGKRKQKVENYKDYLKYFVPMSSREVPTQSERRGDLSNILEIASSSTCNDEIVMIAPVINNINYQLIKRVKKYFPQSYFCLLPQGFFRKMDKQGRVTPTTYDFPDEIIRFLNFICLSELDTKEADTKAKKWSMLGPVVAVTRAQKGSSLYKKGDRIDTSAFRIDNISDPTGAGDVFAAGFSYFYFKSRDIYKSLEFAHAAAALSLRYRSFELQYTYPDILNLAKHQKRGIRL